MRSLIDILDLTTDEIEELIQVIKQKIYETHGVNIEEEVRYID